MVGAILRKNKIKIEINCLLFWCKIMQCNILKKVNHMHVVYNCITCLWIYLCVLLEVNRDLTSHSHRVLHMFALKIVWRIIFRLKTCDTVIYCQPHKIMGYLTFHKWLVSVCNIHMTYEWYKPKPVTCEKWVMLLFY